MKSRKRAYVKCLTRLNVFEKRTTQLFFLILVIVAAPDHLYPSDKEDAQKLAQTIEKNYELKGSIEVGATLEQYLAYAALHNPELEAAFYKWKSGLEKTAVASAIPDPMFSYSYFIENVETRVGPQNQKFSLKQPYPWFGTLSTKGDIAFEAANAAYQKYQSKKLRLFLKVKSAYYDYYYLGREIEITETNMELLRYWEAVARTKYKAALKQHHDVIKAQVELGKLEDRLLTLEDKKAPVAAKLKEALNLPESVDLPLPEGLYVPEVTIDTEKVKNDIIANNPDLKAVGHIIEKNEAAVRLAKKSSYPNFIFGIDYIETGEALNPMMDDSGKDPWIANISINLPLWFGKNKAKRNAARANLEMAKYTLKNTENNLMTVAERVVFEYKDAERKIYLFRDGLIPKTEQLLNAAYTAYQAGETDFLNVIDAQRQLLNFQLQLELALINKTKKLAEIEMLTGKEMQN